MEEVPQIIERSAFSDNILYFTFDGQLNRMEFILIMDTWYCFWHYQVIYFSGAKWVLANSESAIPEHDFKILMTEWDSSK